MKLSLFINSRNFPEIMEIYSKEGFLIISLRNCQGVLLRRRHPPTPYIQPGGVSYATIRARVLYKCLHTQKHMVSGNLLNSLNNSQ